MTTLELLQSLSPRGSNGKVSSRVALAALLLRINGKPAPRPEVHYAAPPAPQTAECDRSNRPDWARHPMPRDYLNKTHITNLDVFRRVVDGMPIDTAVEILFPNPTEEK